VSKYFIKLLGEDKLGTLFNITSGLGIEVLPGRSNYSVGKGAALRLMEYIHSGMFHGNFLKYVH
jgi:hypothetical protein